MNWKVIGSMVKQNGKTGNMSFQNIYRGKKVLITGHTGFKGSWLAIWLRELGAEVFGYALAPQTDMDNFVSTGLASKINHHIGDVRDLSALKDYFNRVSPDFAFHLAAQPLVLLSYADPVGTFETNLMGVVNFFEAVRNTPSVKVAVNVTSDKCYENKEWVWGYRENEAMGGKDPYSASKGCAEIITNSYLSSFFSNTDCNIASARAGNVIGGGDWALDRIVPDFFRAVIANESTFVRNPRATRPWQHVLEPLSGYLALGEALYNKGKNYSGGWNFGPEDVENYSVGHLIGKIIDIYKDGSVETPVVNEALHEAHLLKLDISKAVNLLKWRPSLTFDETVQFTVNGYITDIGNTSVMADRIKQISDYTKIAESKNILWAK